MFFSIYAGLFFQFIIRQFQTGIRPTDEVLEIGPGTGNMTQKLLEKANV